MPTGPVMPQMVFSLSISPEEYQRYYRGTAKTVVTRAEDGRTLRFPAEQLRRFVDHSGVNGRFVIEFSNSNKLVSLTRIK